MDKKRIHTLEAMHRDHHHWHMEHTAWKEDIANWRSQHEDMLADLARIEADVRKYSDVMDSYAEEVDRQNASLQRHEHGIVELIGHGKGMEEQVRMVAVHDDVAVRHESQRKGHERIKRHHYFMLARMAMLKEAIKIDFCQLVGRSNGPPGIDAATYDAVYQAE